MVKHVPQADEKSAKMGWFFDPGFIQNVQRVAADIENPSMEAIDSVLFALREMGFIKVAGTCEHGFTVDDCVAGLCELKKENEELVTFTTRHYCPACGEQSHTPLPVILPGQYDWKCPKCGERFRIDIGFYEKEEGER